MDVEGLFFKIGAQFDGLQKAFGDIDTMMRLQLAGAAIDVGRTMTENLTRPLIEMGTAALKLGSDFQQTKIAFTTMLGSAERATAFLNELKAFAAGTPFEFPGLVDAARRLQALGFASDQVIPSLRAIGDAAAALGGGAQMIDRVTLALGQMQSKGKVSAQEINQLAESGINAWKILAEGMGKTIPEVMKLAEKGMINAARAVPEILEGLNKQFAGMMAKQSQTLAGQWSNVKDQITFIMMDLGEALAPAAGRALEALKPLLTVAESLVAGFKELSPETQTLAIAIAGIAAATGPVLVALGSLGLAITTIQTGLAALGVSGITAVGMLTSLGSAVVVVAGAFAGWRLGEWLAKNVEYFQRWGEGIAKLVDQLPGVQRVTQALAGVPAANKSLADSITLLEAKLKAKGIVLDKAGLSAEEYSKRLRNMALAIAPTTVETEKNTGVVKTNQAAWLLSGEAIQKATKHHKEAAEAAAAHAKGVALVAELNRKHMADFAKEAKAAADATDSAFKRLQDSMKPLGNTFHEIYANLKKIGTEGVSYLNSLGLGVQNLDAGITNVGTEGVAYLESLGIAIGELNPPLQNASKGMDGVGKATSALGNQISTVFTDFGRNIADSILKWDGFAEAGKKAVMSVAEVIVRTLVEGALKSVMNGLSSITNQLGGIGKSIAGLFGGGTSAVTGAAGGSGGAAGGASGAAGAAGGIMGTIGAIGSIGSLISGVIGNFQFAGMNRTLDLIEKEVRYSQIHLQNILETANKWWPWMENLAQLQRLEGIERALVEGGGGGGLQDVVNVFAESQKTTHNWLKIISEGVWATYSAVAKPGWQTTIPGRTPSVPITGNTAPFTGAPNTTINVAVTTNSSNPYSQGLSIAQGINAIIPARI